MGLTRERREARFEQILDTAKLFARNFNAIYLVGRARNHYWITAREQYPGRKPSSTWMKSIACKVFPDQRIEWL
jgi:hypothetical protein